jgi:hypothetical protein
MCFFHEDSRQADRRAKSTKRKKERKTSMRKILLAALALSTVAAAATSASAQTPRKPLRAAQPAITANTVVEEGQVRGADPDPYVRFEMIREIDPANANG